MTTSTRRTTGAKERQRPSISLIFRIRPSNGRRHLSVSHLRWLFYSFFPLSNWHCIYCFFSFSPQPLETPEVLLADQAFHIHPCSIRSLYEQLKRAKDVPIQEAPVVISKPSKKCITAIFFLTIASLAGCGALLC